MLNRFILLRSFACILLACQPMTARAQDVCDVNYETITALFEPGFGSYSVWEAVLSEGQRREVFKSVVDMGAGVTLAAGEMSPLPGVNPVVMLAGFDKRGRVTWEKYHNVSAVTEVVKIVKAGDRIVLMANRDLKGEGKTVWIGFFDDQGGFKDQKVIREKGRDLIGRDMALSPDGKRIVIALSHETKGGTPDKPVYTYSPEVRVFDVKGKFIIKRAYVMGASAEILGISAGLYGEEKGEAIIATGYVDYEGGRKSGWIMRLGPDAAMVWQQPFSRGRHAKIKRSAGYQRDYILTLGDALPIDGGNVGSWLMLLDASSGQVKWQRFFNGAYHYYAADIAVHPQGPIAVMMQARVPGERDPKAPKVPLMEEDGTIIGKMDYVHTLLLNPRGVTLSGESYFKGFGANAYQLVISGDGRFLIAGSAETPYAEIYQKFAGMNDPPASGGVDAAVLSKAGLPGAELTVGALPTNGQNAAPAPNLPEAAVPDGSLSGLALLNKKVAESVEKKDEAAPAPAEEAALPKTTLDGWVFAGNGPEEYKDPCIKPETALP